MNRSARRANAKRVGRGSSASKLLEQALQHQRAGRQRQAIDAFKLVLAKRPNDSKALHGLGLARYHAGRHAEASELLGRAISVNGNDPKMHTNRALALQGLGNLAEAERTARRAIEIEPTYAIGHNNLGVVLRARRDLPGAEASFRAALALDADYEKAHANLGDVLRRQGKTEDAEESYRRALELQPDNSETNNRLGIVLWEQGKLNDAEAALRRAIELRPNFARAYDNLGNLQRDQGKLREAEASLRRVLEIRPHDARTLRNLGIVLADGLHLDQAEKAYRRSLELDPSKADVHYNQALLLLLRGKFPEGWEEHEWRWKTKQFRRDKRRFSQPQWNGDVLRDQTLLLHAEQGFGDSIQFVRYAAFAASRVGRVILRCPRGLVKLMRSVEGIDEVATSRSKLPGFDVHCPLMSLPRLHGSNLENVPPGVPYLRPDPSSVSAWSERLAGPGLKVGLVWAGNNKHLNDRNRSLGEGDLRCLVGFPGPRLFSLQVGPRSADLNALPDRGALVDLSPDLTDFSETAAAIANLDLVISVDSAVAHLAGALKKPVWILLPFVPDWRWLTGREDSMWYPSARLYRQNAPGEWQSVLDRVRGDLSSILDGRAVAGVKS